MAKLLDSKDVVEFKELLMANTIQIDTMYQLLIQKGYFTEAEFLEKMKQVQAAYGKVKEKGHWVNFDEPVKSRIFRIEP